MARTAHKPFPIRFGYACLVGMLLPAVSGALPFASTELQADVKISINGGGPWVKGTPPDPVIDLGNGISFIANPNVTNSAGAASLAVAVGAGGVDIKSDIDPPKAGETIIQRNIRAFKIFRQVDAGTYTSVPLRTAKAVPVSVSASPITARSFPHEGNVFDNTLDAINGFKASIGGVAANGDELARFKVNQETRAKTAARALEYAGADAVSVGSVDGVKLQNRFNVLFPTPAAFKPTIDMQWDISKFKLRADPTAALAFMHHVVNVKQTVGANSSTQTVGFTYKMIDGKLTQTTYHEGVAGSTPVKDWFAANTALAGSTLSLKAGAAPLKVAIPMRADFLANGAQETVDFQNINYQFSFESPPVANGQGGKKMGYRPDKGAGGNNLHWDTASQVLSLDPVPVNLLAPNPDETDQARYAGDPVLERGTLEFDPLIYAMDVDGRRYFAGQRLHLLVDGVERFSAAMPGLVFDPSLVGRHGFSLFAPLVDLQFDDMFLPDSLFLTEFRDFLLFNHSHVPELFISLGSDLLARGDALWDSNIDTAAAIDVSFSKAPVPLTSALLLIGLLAAVAVRRRAARGRQGRLGS